MTQLSPVTCLTIVAESILERRLLDDLRAAGALGWTLTPAQGVGPRGRRVSEIEGGNIRVEVLAEEDVIDRIWSLLEEQYFPDYAMAAWSQTVNVARPQRYTGNPR
jgi:hypothetical protein